MPSQMHAPADYETRIVSSTTTAPFTYTLDGVETNATQALVGAGGVAGEDGRGAAPGEERAATEPLSLTAPVDYAAPAIIAMVGAPGSGKSTWAAKRFAGHVVSTEAIREGDHPYDVVTRAFAEVEKRLAAGELVVLDACNLRAVARRRILNMAAKYQAQAHAVLVRASLEDCLAAQDTRKHPVDRDVVERDVAIAATVAGRLQRETWNSVAILERGDAISEARFLVGGETRSLTASAELGTVEDLEDGGYRISGHAAVFESDSRPLPDGRGGKFVERIMRGAFRRALAAPGLDVVLLVNHSHDQILARTSNGTLRMVETPKGLAIEADVAPTSWAADLRILLERGDMSAMSFGFDVAKDRWYQSPDGTVRRDISDVATLWDVSVVSMPAYPDTDVALRAADVEPATVSPNITESTADAERGRVALSILRRRVELSARVAAPTPTPEVDK